MSNAPVFGVEFTTRGGQAVTVQADLEFRPLRWKATANGGPSECEIAVTGTRAGVKALRDWLRYGVQVYNPAGSIVWWGYVHEVALQLAGWTVTVSLENLRNRVAVTYSSLEGAIESAQTTAWADDLASQAEYGVREQFESIGQATTTMATAYRDRTLAQAARPGYGRAFAQDTRPGAVLRCRGWYATLGWRYYQRTDGRLEHMPADTETQPIGWGIAASNQIGFGDAAIHDVAERLGALLTGMKVTVSGSSSNNKTFTVSDGTSEEVETYSNNSIRFEPSDDIFDSWAGMNIVKSDHWLRVQGSAANSRWHWVGSGGADHVRTSAAVSGAIVNEAAGPTITLTQAQKLACFEAATAEAPGTASAVNVTLHGHQVAQRFTLAAAMKIDRVMVEAAKVGAPGDTLAVEVYNDSAGSIGTLRTSGALAAASLTENLTAVWVPVTTNTLPAGSYWIVVKRSGAVNGVNYFTVGMTPTAYGACQMWTGSAWTTHAPGWFLRFRLWAVEDTGALAETMLAGKAQFVTLATGYLSGVNGYPTMDQQAAVSDELARLTGIGATAGARVLVSVSPDLVLRLTTQPTATPGETLRMFTAGGRVRLTDAAGSPWPRGLLPAGSWAELADLDSDLAGEGGLSPAFVEAAEYDADGDEWRIEFEGERTLLDILRVQAG
jgi:hypothetical protein